MDKEQKDRILKYLCRKCSIERFAYDNDNYLQFYYFKKYRIINQNVLLEHHKSRNLIKPFPFVTKQYKNQHILDLLLHWSGKGFYLSNGLNRCGDDYYVMILKPFTSIYELQIEMDLEK